MHLHRTKLIAAAILALAPHALPQNGGLRILDLRGTPYERGFQHGETLRIEISEMIETWRQDISDTSGMESADFVRGFLAATEFEAAARRHTPELLDEVRGIAAGAGQSYATMLAFQLFDEVWAQAGLVERHRCSTIGVDRDGESPGLVAQNLDLPVWMHRHPTVLRIHHPDRELQSLVVTIPGLLGANGINDHRVAVGVNTILQLRPSPNGLPVAFVVRGMLAEESHGAAVAFLKRVPHASGQAYTVGGPDTSPCFECSAAGVVRWQPVGREGCTWHTNHPLVSHDWSMPYLAKAQESGFAPEQHPRCPRFDALDRALPAGLRPTIAQVTAALSITGPSSPVANDYTYCCSIMVLGTSPELRIAFGKPTLSEFEALRFE